MEEPEMTHEEMDEMMDDQEDGEIDRQEASGEISEELQEMYGGEGGLGTASIPASANQHEFLKEAAFNDKEPLRTTFLTESELGRPLFNVRFLSDMEDVVKSYIDVVALKIFGTIDANAIAGYFREKRVNVTESGMSNKGFAMNLNVTRRMDATRKRVREMPPEMKGGKK